MLLLLLLQDDHMDLQVLVAEHHWQFDSPLHGVLEVYQLQV